MSGQKVLAFGDKPFFGFLRYSAVAKTCPTRCLEGSEGESGSRCESHAERRDRGREAFGEGQGRGQRRKRAPLRSQPCLAVTPSGSQASQVGQARNQPFSSCSLRVVPLVTCYTGKWIHWDWFPPGFFFSGWQTLEILLTGFESLVRAYMSRFLTFAYQSVGH